MTVMQSTNSHLLTFNRGDCPNLSGMIKTISVIMPAQNILLQELFGLGCIFSSIDVTESSKTHYRNYIRILKPGDPFVLPSYCYLSL